MGVANSPTNVAKKIQVNTCNLIMLNLLCMNCKPEQPRNSRSSISLVLNVGFAWLTAVIMGFEKFLTTLYYWILFIFLVELLLCAGWWTVESTITPSKVSRQRWYCLPVLRTAYTTLTYYIYTHTYFYPLLSFVINTSILLYFVVIINARVFFIKFLS